MNVCALLSLSVLSAKAQTTYMEMEQLTVNDQVTTVITASEPIRFVDISTDKVVGDQPINNIIRLKPKEAGHEDGEVLAMENGVDTVIGSQGTYVSGGEAQRLSIARAMLKNAPILILDEATAFADPDNEAKVQQAFTKLSAGKTVIMIAHRLSSVVDADRICVLKDGGIVEQGNHEILLEQNGLYAHMWEEYNKSVSWKVGKGEK